MNLLQLAPRVCWPLDTGAKLRNYHLARVLAERSRVTLLAFTDDEQTPTEQTPYDQVIAVRRDPAYTLSKLLRGALGGIPLPVLNYTTEAMKRALDLVLREKDFDIVQVESIHLMAYLPIIRAARQPPITVCDWHNIESELMRRYSEREPSLPRRVYARRTARLMSEFEKRALGEFDAHVVVSQRDAERLRKLDPAASIFLIENGVDTAYYSEALVESPNQSMLKKRIVFVGSMDYHANVDGVLSFAGNVWPRIRDRHPNLVFTIVGREPTAEVRELSSVPGVEVTGTVDDVRPYYRDAVAAIVPLNVGGGSRLKILEAMAAGVPVVSTRLGAEGLEVRDRENILIVETNEKMAEAIIRMIDDPEQRNEIILGGRKLVAERYDWSRLGAQLFDTYRKLSSERSKAL